MVKIEKWIILVLSVLISITNPLEAQQRKGDMRKPFVFSQQFKHSVGAGATFFKAEQTQEPVFHVD